MSRCFPFPPPGYDLKARPDDVNLIIKDKQKHKKHKEKKDKDKKERKENKEKERSVDKHKDDKKRKRKEHREKKDKNKDEQNGEKKNAGSLVNPVDGIHDKRAVVELANRVRSNDGATGNHMVQKITVVEKEKVNLLGKVLENGNGMLAANVQSLTIDSRRLGNGLFKVEGSPCQMDTVEKRKEGKETNGHRNNAVEGDGSKNEDKNNNMKAEDKKKKEKTKKEMGFSKEKFTKKETSDRNILDFHSNQDCQGKLPKLKELNGFLHANGVRSDNMSRPVIVSHQAGEIGSGVRPSQNTINLGVGRSVIADEKVNVKLSSPQSVIDNVRNIGPRQTADNAKNNRVVSNGVITPHIIHMERKMEPCQINNSVAVVKKIVNPSADGKFPSSHSFVENGVKMAMQAPDVVHKMMHNKELRMNKSLEGKNNSSLMLPSASLKQKEKVATTMKPPHPDLKYLSKILTVPELVKWPQCDDQEWLFGREDSQTKRPKLASPEIQSTKEVWSEAVILESTGAIALPYVIPY